MQLSMKFLKTTLCSVHSPFILPVVHSILRKAGPQTSCQVLVVISVAHHSSSPPSTNQTQALTAAMRTTRKAIVRQRCSWTFEVSDSICVFPPIAQVHFYVFAGMLTARTKHNTKKIIYFYFMINTKALKPKLYAIKSIKEKDGVRRIGIQKCHKIQCNILTDK